jgi:hypothetical protein
MKRWAQTPLKVALKSTFYNKNIFYIKNVTVNFSYQNIFCKSKPDFLQAGLLIVYDIMNMPTVSKTYEKISKKTSIFTTTILWRLSNRDSHCKIDTKSWGGNPKQNHCKNPAQLDETMAKKQNNLLSLQGLKVHKNENFFGFDFEFCTISLLVMHK